MCLDLEYKPCLKSGNAPEGTSKNVCAGEFGDCTPTCLILQMRKGLLIPVSTHDIHILSGQKHLSPHPAHPIQPLSSLKLPLRNLFSRLPPSCPALLLESDASSPLL